MEDFSIVNWLAVIAGTLVSFLVGWLWYSPKLFGTKWAEGCGVTLGNADEMPKFAMLAQLFALLLLALLIGITATFNALITAILGILGILAAATFVLSSGAFVKKSRYALTVEFFYILVSGIIMILAQAAL